MSWDPEYARAGHVVVHHTAGTNSYSAGQSASIVRGIYYYHAVVLDWGDIGYNFLVDKFGTVFEGRSGSVAAPAGRMSIGAHARGVNTGTMGISMMGDYSTVSPLGRQLSLRGQDGRMVPQTSWHLRCHRLGGPARVDHRALEKPSGHLAHGAQLGVRGGHCAVVPPSWRYPWCRC